MSFSVEQVDAAQAVYTKRTLAIYDLFVLGLSNRWIWRCPTPYIVTHYNRFLSANHLDVGVGTGYFPDRCLFPSESPRVALMDLNEETLAYASQRIARYRPEQYRRNVLEPIPFKGEKFDSIAINYLLHCLPGSISEKAIAFDHLKELMNPGASIFGSTLLQGGVERSWFARRLMAIYNKKGIFSNQADDLETLKDELSRRFSDVSVTVVGCAALFSARA